MLLSGINKKELDAIKTSVKPEVSELLAVEECSELQKAILKIQRGQRSLQEKEDVIEEMADVLLAVQYLANSYGFEEDVAKKVQEKHQENHSRVVFGSFTQKQKFPSPYDVTDSILAQFKKEMGTTQWEDIRADYFLTDKLVLSVGGTFNGYRLEVGKYKKSLNGPTMNIAPYPEYEQDIPYKCSETLEYRIVDVIEKLQKNF